MTSPIDGSYIKDDAFVLKILLVEGGIDNAQERIEQGQEHRLTGVGPKNDLKQDVVE